MLRTLLCSLALSAFLAGGLLADDTKDKNTKGDKNKHKCQAKITKVDAKKGTITVHMKDKDGKEMEKTFTLTEDVRMLDDTGRVAAIDVFQSGNEVLIVEADGRFARCTSNGTAPTRAPRPTKAARRKPATSDAACG